MTINDDTATDTDLDNDTDQDGDGDQNGDGGQQDQEPEPFAVTMGRVAGYRKYRARSAADFAGAQEIPQTYLQPSDLLLPGYDELVKDLPDGLKADVQKIRDGLIAVEEAYAINTAKDDEIRLWREVEEDLKQKQADAALAAKKARIAEQIKQTQAVDAVAAAGHSADAAALQALEAAVQVIDDPATSWEEKDAAAGEAIDKMAAVEVGTEQSPVTFDVEEFMRDVNSELEQRKEK